MGACSRLKCVFPVSIFCTSRGSLNSNSASEISEKKAEAVMNSDNCKNRNVIGSLKIKIEWHVCPGTWIPSS